MTAQTIGRIKEFYSQADPWLEFFWGGSSGMIHFGYFAGNENASHQDSLLETVRQAALRLNLEGGEKILDAGCGIGGTAVWLAKNCNVSVDGISNLSLHVEKSTQFARQNGLNVPGDVSFQLLDYTDTGLPSESYDGIVAIESVCYAPETVDFLREAFRLLKPGGRLVVLDGFRTRRDLTDAEAALMTSWLSGWGAEDIDTIDEFCEKAKDQSFNDVRFEDIQGGFNRSHQRSHLMAKICMPAVWLANRAGLMSDVLYAHCRAGCDLWRSVEQGLCVQGIFSATKPASE